MLNKLLKKHLKNEKGLTLIELLVVVVILGIIAAIAVVSIGGILDNSKRDAHAANAQQMVNAAKMWATGNANGTALDDGAESLTLKKLYDEKLIDTMVDPDTKTNSYDLAKSKVDVTKTASTFTYKVVLVGKEKEIKETTPDKLDRSAVSEIKAP
ncbi:type II secretion system protein [Fictibacillus sp. 18YEL24]|uniref:type II secretion system protein n=1 Tax=Fictibacillus sp. 18YEL24 TaxID=2745875 RepID=UPI0018CE299D|nr:type II secretion system protein [Fictibacillus sp. 18YEL24]MBH0169376.1 type II secretion system protein [Fictibacillus sp. 18YEL24]